MTTSPKPKTARWSLILVIVLFVVVTVVFLIAFVVETEDEMATPEATVELSADTYADVVAGLLENADPANGALLVQSETCAACHLVGAQSQVAPSFTEIVEVAPNRRPPLTAAAYIYESIVDPLAYVVEGYGPSMPQDYREKLSDQELGDIIAYLLTPASE